MLMKRGLLVALSLATLVVFAQAQQAEARLLKAEPLPTPQPALTSAASPDCCTPQPVCCPTPCVTYRHRGPKLCCDCCQPGTPLTLAVKNPCTGCEVPVSVCLPACCTGDPKVCCHPGVLGREVIEYQWCCGYNVRVAFKPCGDVLVVTWGR